MIHHQTKSAWRHFKFIFPYTSQICGVELCRLLQLLLSVITSWGSGYFPSILITIDHIFTSVKRRIQWNNNSTDKHILKNHSRSYSYSELDIHHDLFLCSKNPGHRRFFPISKFKITDLPEGFRFTDIVNFIELFSSIVVKITLDDISSGRPKGSIFDLNNPNEGACSYGSGYLWNAQCCQWRCDVACPCRQCHQLPVTEWGELRLVTAKHVVFDDVEARGATVDLFYNDPHDLSSVIQLIGLRVVDSDMEGDRCEMIVIVHNRDLWYLLVQVIEYCYNSKRAQGAIENLTVQRGKNFLTVIISHPHGSSKQVSVGRCLNRHVSDSGTPLLQRTHYDYDTPTCPGSSGAPVIVFGCERQTMSFAPHTRWDKGRKRNASGHAFELERAEFWVDPSMPKSVINLRDILWSKHISKSQKVRLLFRICRKWLTRFRDSLVWLKLDRIFDFKSQKTNVTQTLTITLETIPDSAEPPETLSDSRTDQKSKQWNSVRAMSCVKQNHEQFIPFHAFNLNNLPPKYQDEDIVQTIGYLGILTGKLTVFSGEKSERTVQGTCHLRYFDSRFVLEKQKCPCSICKSSSRPQKKWAKFIASSSAHVMEKLKDGGHYECDLLYDDEKLTENTRKLYGQSILKFDLDNDSCDFELVTHDMELCTMVNKTLKDFWRSVEQLESKWLNTSPPYLVVIPSHPHGFSKHVTVGLTVGNDTAPVYVNGRCLHSDCAVPVNHNTGTDVISLKNISNVISPDVIGLQQEKSGLNKGVHNPSTDITTPSTDITTLGTDITTPSTDKQIPVTEIPKPVTETPIPVTEISSPTTDIPTPTTDINTSNGEMPFQIWKAPSRFTLYSPKQYKYTNATCNGSAGAPLFILTGGRILNIYSLHSGSHYPDNCNISSLTVDVNDIFLKIQNIWKTA